MESKTPINQTINMLYSSPKKLSRELVIKPSRKHWSIFWSIERSNSHVAFRKLQ